MTMFKNKLFWLIVIFTFNFFALQAKENIGVSNKQALNYSKLAAGCTDATSQIDLDINNVRTRILGAGDFWWDLNDAKYVIPKVDPTTGVIPVSSSYAGALWIGGIDAGGQLKIAAQTYRQSGNDFWPGILDPTGSVTSDVCNSYDRHWKINRTEIDQFIADFEAAGGSISESSIPASIKEWPAYGNPYAIGKAGAPIEVPRDLAPYVDTDNDGQYNPLLGDYPDVDGDQAIFWVYNDKGNIHTESGGDAIGLEIQATAFAFQTNDEVNDMTFYRYNVINFATTALDSVYFGQWVDSDLGCFSDDWVGCDTTLSLGMCFNGDSKDEPCPAGYGDNPPIFGTDFFQGPIKYIYEGGAIVDSFRLGMSAFLYYNNDFTIIGNPEVASHYYGYLSGTWKDGSPFTYGGNGYGGTDPSPYMFPSDPSDGSGWSECSEGLTPFDRRYLQSSGPFRLEPGAKNEVVVGAVWVRPPLSGGCNTTFDQIKLADQKAQALFDADFELIDGPVAPDMSIRELDQELILSLTNGPTSNNVGESYEEADPILVSIISQIPDSVIEANPGLADSTYNFQGYKIYQLVNGQISSSEFSDPTKARLIYQCDLKDGVKKIINYSFDPLLGATVPQLMVDGADAGIQHTFNVTSDAFAQGTTNLINFKTYYFSVVAYAYNNFLNYDPTDENSQKKPYLEGRSGITTYTAIPHKPDPENNGMQLNAEYGDGPEIKKIEGRGNGGNFLDLTDATVENILVSGEDNAPVYQGRKAPIDIKVFDPVRVPAADFQLKLVDSSATGFEASGYLVDKDSTYWILTNLTTGEVVNSDFPINFVNEQIIPEWGLAVTVKAVDPPGPDNSFAVYVPNEENNGFISATMEFANSNNQWLTGVPDVDGPIFLNWIRSGLSSDAGFPDYLGQDDDEVYETVLGGTFAPARLVGADNITASEIYQPFKSIIGLTGSSTGIPQIQLNALIGVDIVFTSDRSKWSQCVVLNTSDGPNAYGETKLDMRQKPSIDQNGNIVAGEVGRSYFPGYAIDVESGKRLNILFGEDPATNQDGNADDMLWNPSASFFNASGFAPVYGGKHYIYVHKTLYDGGKNIHDSLAWAGTVKPTSVIYRDIIKNVCWVGMPFLTPGASLLSFTDGLIPTETKVKLRITRPYEKVIYTSENGGIPIYTFSTRDLAPTVGNQELASSALDLINVVPNPYYAYSGYETSTIDNRIKITNLPSKCVISIYTLDGTLIRRLTRDVTPDNTAGGELNKQSTNLDTSVEWDLKNSKNIPVASGMYLIHIDAGELGEKTLKWMGIMRPIDLDTF